MHHLTTFQLLLVALAWAIGLHFARVGRVALKNAWRLEHAGAADASFDAIWDHDRAVKRAGTQAVLKLVVGFTTLVMIGGFTFVVAVDMFFATFGH
ncbi:hypothetical protein [Burkholderia gladioli]|uniref:hypothetical protein n=1 Tax=Burkholderia gladioli TaxID=28095 RepID=UPI00163EEFCA|nr:hypothetical protein [Burkholderia gladioli]